MDEVLDYLYSFINYETNNSFSYNSLHYNVKRTKKLLSLLGNPEKSMSFIHVAGTKGKGSVCTILTHLLTIQGYITGLFTSPHIQRVNERIQVNLHEISDDNLIELVNLLPPLIARFPDSNKPTTFEILTALSIHHFREKNVEFAVLETGMGGRFDSTNVVKPLISVITSISFDHMDKLGHTLKEITQEKAGIIKPGKPVIVGPQPFREASPILHSVARKLNSPYYDVDTLCSYEITSYNERGSYFNATMDSTRFNNLFLSLTGEHQVQNALTAMLTLKTIKLLPLNNDIIRKALYALRIKTRLELIEAGRRFVLDSAHNADSARVVIQAIVKYYRYRQLVAIVGIVKGKDVEGILSHITSFCTHLIITEPITHKALDSEYVFSIAKKLFPHALFVRNIQKAIEHAYEHTTPDDLILITGSFYTTAPAREIILKTLTV